MSSRPLIASALVAALFTPAANADSLAETLPDTLRDLEKQAEEFLTDEARRAAERLLPMIETLMERLPLVIDNLPDYQMPEILPNGDIIIRRKRTLPPINPDAPPLPEDGIKT